MMFLDSSIAISIVLIMSLFLYNSSNITVDLMNKAAIKTNSIYFKYNRIKSS